jgi:hypothetical protein
MSSKRLREENSKKKKLIFPEYLRVNYMTLAYKEDTPLSKIGTQRRNYNDNESPAKVVCKEIPKRERLVYKQPPEQKIELFITNLTDDVPATVVGGEKSPIKKLIVSEGQRMDHVSLVKAKQRPRWKGNTI